MAGGQKGQTTTTTSKTVNAQDSVVATDGSLVASNAWVVGEGGELNITDGGAFALVESLGGQFLDSVKSLFVSATAGVNQNVSNLLDANRQVSQESALQAQENTNKLLMFITAGVVILGGIYFYKQ